MKIKYPKNCVGLSPRLKEVLDTVYAKRPLLEYEVTSKDPRNDLANAVTVWQDGQELGTIDSQRTRYSPSNNDHSTWFAVTCDNIEKERGDRNTKFCKNAKAAARAAIELFTKKPLAELGKSLILDVRSAIESLAQRTTYDFRNSFNMSATMVANYFTDLYLDKNPPFPKESKDQIESKNILRKKENMEIADNVLTHMKNHNGYCIRMMQDETLLCTHIGNPATTSKHQSTYELDQYTQEKLVMLKVLDDNQFAADIGVKYKRDDGNIPYTVYFVVAGETVTH